MFERLKKKWNVNGWRLLLILITFAVGGSLTGYLGKKIMEVLGLKVAGFTIILYIVVVTLIWPICVLAVSLLTGQFQFFTHYLKKLFGRIGGRRSASNDRSQQL